MVRAHRVFFGALFAVATLVPVCLASDKATNQPAVTIEDSTGQFVFELLPKSFQKNPKIDITVITEMTDEGRNVTPASREHPAYYVAQSGGYHVLGYRYAGERSPPTEDLERRLKNALSTNGYLPATPEHPPTVAVVYWWGSHNQGASQFARAALVGGIKFAQEYEDAISRGSFGQMEYLGGAFANHFSSYQSAFAMFDPFELFRNRDGRTMTLVEQARNEIYFIVASAYDYAAIARGQKLLLWRTKMTADAGGVSIDDGLAAVIARASHYFGRDMPVAATIFKPVRGAATVEIGNMTVEEYLPTTPAPEPAKEPVKEPAKTPAKQ